MLVLLQDMDLHPQVRDDVLKVWTDEDEGGPGVLEVVGEAGGRVPGWRY